jgi:hypothetical protein
MSWKKYVLVLIWLPSAVPPECFSVLLLQKMCRAEQTNQQELLCTSESALASHTSPVYRKIVILENWPERSHKVHSAFWCKPNDLLVAGFQRHAKTTITPELTLVPRVFLRLSDSDSTSPEKSSCLPPAPLLEPGIACIERSICILLPRARRTLNDCVGNFLE